MGGRGNSGNRNSGDITTNSNGTISIKFQQRGESRIYTGDAKLPAKDTFPMFQTLEEADAYSNSESTFRKSIENGEEYPSIFKSGSRAKGNLKYVVGFSSDRKKLPKGYRWTEIEF